MEKQNRITRRLEPLLAHDRPSKLKKTKVIENSNNIIQQI